MVHFCKHVCAWMPAHPHTYPFRETGAHALSWNEMVITWVLSSPQLQVQQEQLWLLHHTSTLAEQWKRFGKCFSSNWILIFLIYFLATPCVIWTHQFPDQGLNLYPLHWKCKLLTTRPSEKSPKWTFKGSILENFSKSKL